VTIVASAPAGLPRVTKLLRFLQFFLGFSECGFCHGDHTAAGFFASPAEAQNAPNFIERKSQRLRLLDKVQTL
jgi:hypothetical protein